MRCVFSLIFIFANWKPFRFAPGLKSFLVVADRYSFKEGLRRAAILLHDMNLCEFGAKALRCQMSTYALSYTVPLPTLYLFPEGEYF